MAAAIQMTSTGDKAPNVEVATRLVREAAQHGAQWVTLPETFFWMGNKEDFDAAAEPITGPTLTTFSALAKELRIGLLAGSILEKGAPDNRVYNTSVLFGPDGQTQAVYRKMHLFDVDIQDGSVYRESTKVAPGNDVVMTPTLVGNVGLSICYDLRFPELYRALVDRGANVFAIPVPGTFDDAQCVVKEVFGDTAFAAAHNLSAVNSINIARVLAQSVYYIWAWLRLPENKREHIEFVVPTGNFGNVLAGWLAHRMGLPVASFRVATNQNDILYRFFTSGEYRQGDVQPSHAPSMDIQAA
ncbi:MAG: pyridoxal-phosphate dependent enzyme, partial [Proteobacteria bacterium]|nr:pyridoxal-phosphate dependent enzyme [Pseudomonadota bacterium]